jgi:hypothetical protein
MAIDANEGAILVDRQQLFTEILSQTVFVVTFGARRDRNVGFQTTQRLGFRDVDMARRTLGDVLFLLTAAFVNELRRDSLRRFSQDDRCFCELVTTVAIRRHRLLRLPVTVKTRCVIGGNGFERQRS